MKKNWLVFVMAVAAISGACNVSQEFVPTAPTPVTGTTSTGSGPSADTPTPPPGGGSSPSVAACGREDLSMDIFPESGQFRPTTLGSTATLHVRNISGKTCELVFSSWDRNNAPAGDPLNQELVDWRAYTLQSGQEVVMGPIEVPDGCYQLDISNGRERPASARTLQAIRWYTGGTCQPAPPPVPPTPVCEGVTAQWSVSGLNLDANPATVTLTARITGDDVSAQWMRTPPGSTGPIANGASATVTMDRPLPGSAPVTHTFTLSATKAGTLCSSDTEAYTVQPLPPSPPPPPPPPPPAPTCEGTTTSLSLAGEPAVTPTAVSGSVSIGLTGTGITGSLAIPGQPAQSVTNGQSVAYSFQRPPAGQPTASYTITLTGSVGDQACATRTVTVTAPPQEPPPPPPPPPTPSCEGVYASLAFVAEPTVTATTVTGAVRSTYGGGVGTVATLSMTGYSDRQVRSGEESPFSYTRPPAGSERQLKIFTLAITAGGQVCKTRSLEYKVWPQGPACTGECR